MKKFAMLLSIIYIFLLSGCVMNYSQTHQKIFDSYHDITIENFLEKTNITLIHSNGHATLAQTEDFYVIDFDMKTTYFFNPMNQEVLKYEDKLDLEFRATSQSVIEFIHEVERDQALSFNKISYLIFDVIKSILNENNKTNIQFDYHYSNRGFYHPFIVVKEKNYEYIDKLSLIIAEFEDVKPSEIKILLDKQRGTRIHITTFGIDIHSNYDDDFILFIKSIVQYIK